MRKELKSDTNNQWASVPEEEPTSGTGDNNKKPKTTTENQWTTTAKNSINDK